MINNNNININIIILEKDKKKKSSMKGLFKFHILSFEFAITKSIRFMS